MNKKTKKKPERSTRTFHPQISDPLKIKTKHGRKSSNGRGKREEKGRAKLS